MFEGESTDTINQPKKKIGCVVMSEQIEPSRFHLLYGHNYLAHFVRIILGGYFVEAL